MSEQVAVVAGAGGEFGRAAEEKLAVAAFMVAGIDRGDQALKQLPDGIWRETADPADPFTAANSRGGL